MLAAYGPGGSSGGLSYGPVFWIVAAVIVVVMIVAVTWFVRRAKAKRSASSSMNTQSHRDQTDRAA